MQRFLRTFDPSLAKGEMFKRLVLQAVVAIPTSYSAAVIDEVANMTAQVPDGTLGEAVTAYMNYRFMGGPEPTWHKRWCDQQDKEDAERASQQ